MPIQLAGRVAAYRTFSAWEKLAVTRKLPFAGSAHSQSDCGQVVAASPCQAKAPICAPEAP